VRRLKTEDGIQYTETMLQAVSNIVTQNDFHSQFGRYWCNRV